MNTIREDFGNGIHIDWKFDPEVGSGAALAEFYFRMADVAADIGEPALADEFWDAGARASLAR